MNGEPIGPASTTYNDWRGTVALDKPDPDRDHIYELVGIDRDRWTIVGFELGGAYDSTLGWVDLVEADTKLGELPKSRPVPVARRAIPRDAVPSDIVFKLLSSFKGWGITFQHRTIVERGLQLVPERDLDLEEPSGDPTDPRAD